MKYPLNTACFWRIRSPTELHIIHFQFKNILMEGPSEETGECEYDFVKLYKGINDYFEENLVVTKCGTQSSSELTNVYKGDQGKTNSKMNKSNHSIREQYVRQISIWQSKQWSWF